MRIKRKNNRFYKTVSVFLAVFFIISFPSKAFAEQVESTAKLEVPRITFTTENGNGTKLLKSDGYVNAEVSIEDVDGTSFSDSVTMKVRGNSTAFDSIAKKSYNFKFSKKKDVLNMGSGKKWALISNIFDPTLARNFVAFSLAKELGIQYTSDFKVVEVVVDGSFRGCYLLIEPVGDGRDRVDIDVKGEDGKKDFLIELEASREEDDVTYFKSNGIRFAVSEPDPPSEEQTNYIKSTMDDVISTIRNGAKDEIESKIDIDSFVKFYLLNEFLKTVDFNFSSVFYYYKDGKLYAGPPWDYDLSSGNVNESFSARYASSYKTDGLFISNYNLYKWLCAKEWFYDLAKAEFSVHYSYFSRIPSENGIIDSFYNTYENVIKRNFNNAGWKVNGYYVNVMKRPLTTYEENYDFYVNWCRERVEWLRDYFGVEPLTEPEETQPVKTDIGNWKVSGIKNMTYTGKGLKQSGILVSKNGEYADFSVKYKNNVNVGTAEITITGKGDYTGTIVKTFKILKAANPIKVTAKATPSAKAMKKTVIKNAITVKRAQGTITYTTNNKKVTAKNGTITVAKGFKKGRTIKVIITVTAKGNRNYKSEKIVKKIRIKIK